MLECWSGVGRVGVAECGGAGMGQDVGCNWGMGGMGVGVGCGLSGVWVV